MNIPTYTPQRAGFYGRHETQLHGTLLMLGGRALPSWKDSKGHPLCLPWPSPPKVKPPPEDELLPPGRALAWGSEHPAWHGRPGAQPTPGGTTSGKALSLLNINLHPKEAPISSPTIVFF